MLFDPARHEPLQVLPWDESRVRRAIERIVHAAEADFSPATYWPAHPLDDDGRAGQPFYPLYFGAAGVIWALHYLEALGAVRLQRSYAAYVDALLPLDRAWLESSGSQDYASYQMGDTGILLLRHALHPSPEVEARLEALIASNRRNPTRELMWGAPGTMLAALFLHERTSDARWASLFRSTASALWSELEWSAAHECQYWVQEMYGRRSTYLDAVHGFVATAVPLVHGRHLLDAATWADWERCIVDTVARTATREGSLANWRAWLEPPGAPTLVQFCHGAPGFLVCLGDLPSAELDDVLCAAGEATWVAGPLRKGSNLCHGTGGNGYAFLKLYQRTGDARWLDRARAFAMHAIVQMEAHAAHHGRLRHSLWTGDPGLAIYLWDCLRERAAFPTLDVFYADSA